MGLGGDNLAAMFRLTMCNKIFPVSNRASDVVDAFVARLNRSGAELALAEPVPFTLASLITKLFTWLMI